MGNRVLQIVITIVIVIAFWNMLDFIIDEYITHEGYAFDPYFSLGLPTIIGLIVELFPKMKEPPTGSKAKSGKGKKRKR